MLSWIIAIIAGFGLLIWSADRFVSGASLVARHLGLSPLLIGMLVVGFGTSAPEMVVSAMAALEGNPALALGNAYGSNIMNIAVILGITALIRPIQVQSRVLRTELPVLAAITVLAGLQLADGDVSRVDAVVLLGVFAMLIGWSILQATRSRGDQLEVEMSQKLQTASMSMRAAILWLLAGLLLLIASSRLLVWGAVNLAAALGVSDLVIGLTIVAIGTSLPELAASLAAARKGEHDMALGNILGSNLFNTLAVVGIAGILEPMTIDPAVLSRDWVAMMVLTLYLFVAGYGFRRHGGRINRYEGGLLLIAYGVYIALLLINR